MLGGMLQIEPVAGDRSGGTGEIRGSGWMAGPYFVAKEPLKKSPNMENVPVHGIEIPMYS